MFNVQEQLRVFGDSQSSAGAQLVKILLFLGTKEAPRSILSSRDRADNPGFESTPPTDRDIVVVLICYYTRDSEGRRVRARKSPAGPKHRAVVQRHVDFINSNTSELADDAPLSRPPEP